jgi:hypothetical protein
MNDIAYTGVARHLGDPARLLGDLTLARGYDLQALEATSRIRFRPEMALAHLRLAELMLEVGDESEALGISIWRFPNCRIYEDANRARTRSQSSGTSRASSSVSDIRSGRFTGPDWGASRRRPGYWQPAAAIATSRTHW